MNMEWMLGLHDIEANNYLRMTDETLLTHVFFPLGSRKFRGDSIRFLGNAPRVFGPFGDAGIPLIMQCPPSFKMDDEEWIYLWNGTGSGWKERVKDVPDLERMPVRALTNLEGLKFSGQH